MSEDNKKENNRFSAFENFSFRKVFRYNLLMLVVFLLLIGVSSFFLLSDQASKLIGGSRYNELSSNSASPRYTLIEKIKYFFSNENKEITEAKNTELDENKKDIEDEGLSEGKALDGSSKSSGSGSSSSSSSQNEGVSFYQSGQKTNTESFKPELSSPGSYASGGQSQTSVSAFDTGSKANVRLGSTASKVVSATARAKNNTSAMDLLKSTYKATIFAARDASNDTARSWTAKAFDLNPEVKDTIEYDEKLRAKLDRINPNSIPAFLKDPNLDMESIKSLKPSDVPGLSSDEDKKGMDIDINPMFNFNMKGEETDEEIDQKSYSVSASNPKTATSPDGKVVQSPSSEPDLGSGISNVTTDEYGYIRVTGSDGTIQIFDPDSGKILGCEIPDAGMCTLPGNDGCPSDVYFV
ncbi:MAG: hypothetical protein ACP5SD_01130 [Elusimicrobiales bacterium]